MKQIFTPFFIVLSFVFAKTSFSQTPNWLFGVGGTGGSCYADGDGIAVSRSGNIYFSGRFGSTISIGGKTLNATSGSYAQVFSGKMDKSGNTIWLKQHVYNGSNDYNYTFAIDDSSNTYCSGVISSGGGGEFLDKRDSLGNLVWSKIFTGNSFAAVYGIAIDKNGNVFATGSMGSTGANFGGTSTPLTSAGSDDMFIAKFDRNGTCIWAKSGGGTGLDGGRSVALDKSGNIYVYGGYNSAAPQFGTINPIPSSGVNGNLFIAKYNSTGTVQWLSVATNSGIGTSYSFWYFREMTIDSSGNTFVTGEFTTTAQFGNLPSLNSYGGKDIFVAKCLNNGQWAWAKNAGGSSDDFGRGIVTDKYGDVYASGNFQDSAHFGSQTAKGSGAGQPNIFIAKYANSAGDLQWVQKGLGNNSIGQALATDRNGFVYVAGTYDGTATLGSISLGPDGNSCSGNIFVAKLDTTPHCKCIAASFTIGSVTTNSAKLQWAAVPCAFGYQFHYRPTGTVTWTTVNSTGTFKTISGLTSSTQYDVQLRTKCDLVPTYSKWSATQTFTTLFACVVPSGITVTNLSATKATISWGAVTGAYSYKLHYRVFGTTTWTNKTILAPAISKLLTGLTANTKYELQLETICDVSGTPHSSWTTIQTFTTTLRMEEGNTISNEIIFYPNPVSNYLTITLPASALLTVTNLLGQQQVVSSKPGVVSQIDVSGYPNGIYFLRAQSGSEVKTAKFVVQH